MTLFCCASSSGATNIQYIYSMHFHWKNGAKFDEQKGVARILTRSNLWLSSGILNRRYNLLHDTFHTVVTCCNTNPKTVCEHWMKSRSSECIADRALRSRDSRLLECQLTCAVTRRFANSTTTGPQYTSTHRTGSGATRICNDMIRISAQALAGMWISATTAAGSCDCWYGNSDGEQQGSEWSYVCTVGRCVAAHLAVSGCDLIDVVTSRAARHTTSMNGWLTE